MIATPTQQIARGLGFGRDWFCPPCTGVPNTDPRPRASSFQGALVELVMRARAADLTDPVERYRVRSALVAVGDALDKLDKEGP